MDVNRCLSHIELDKTIIIIVIIMVRKVCQYIRKYKEWEPNMFFVLYDGWISTTGFTCTECYILLEPN